MENAKDSVRDFWNAKSCGEVYAEGATLVEQLAAQARERYRLEPGIPVFAGFHDAPGKDVLEIGVGMGADHLEWAKAGPRALTGVDLTDRAVNFTRERLRLHGLYSDLRISDAENLPYPDNSFDIVYSYGVLHHSPDTARAIREVYRVLRPGGSTRIMIYHTPSLVGYMLWLRYGLMAGRPGRSLREIYAAHLESPGTRAFTVEEARQLMAGFDSVTIQVVLGPGDLLEGGVGQRHQGPMLRLAKAIWPRWFMRSAMKNFGLGMTIRASKPA